MTNDLKKLLESVIDAIVEGDSVAAQASFHDYLRAKTQAILLGESMPMLPGADTEEEERERAIIMNTLENNYGISDAVQEFLGWSRRQAQNSDGTNWDDCVDAIMNDPELKAQFLSEE